MSDEQAGGDTGEAYDVVVLGGGAAGLSGALTLARALRSVAVVDAGEPRNARAAGVHGFLTRDGMAPADLVRAGREEVRRYGAELVDATATRVRRSGPLFEAVLDDGRRLRARKLLVATGLVDELPGIEGLAERWGREVIQCPYCHGHEVRGQRIGVLAHPAAPVAQATLYTQWSSDVLLFRHEAEPLSPEDSERAEARGVTVVDGRVERLVVEEDRLTGVQVTDGPVVPVDVFALEPRFLARIELLGELGLREQDHPMGEVLSAAAPADSVAPGVWLAGNVVDLGGQVVGAAADGARAAIGIHCELLEEDVARDVELLRARHDREV